jgi:hypothetical protein
MNLPDIPKYVADYFNFFIDFGSSPKKALSPYKAKGRIDETLVVFAALGVVFCWLLLLLCQKLARAHGDKGSVLEWMDRVDVDTLPFAALVVSILFAFLTHVTIRVVNYPSEYMGRRRQNAVDVTGETSSLPAINLKDTINGILAFFSFAPVIIAAGLLISLCILFASGPHIGRSYLLFSILPCAGISTVALLHFLPTALISVHPNSCRKKIDTAFYIMLLLVGLLTYWLVKVINPTAGKP